MKVRELLSWAVGVLGEPEDTKKGEGIYILSTLLGINTANLFARMDEVVIREVEEDFKDMVLRRSEGEPLQYILGFAEFWGMKFKVSKGVFIPRVDTEAIVEVAIEHISSEGVKVIDVGTGSGNIAIAVAKELKDSKVFGVDISPEAVMIAKHNADVHGVDVGFAVSDMFSAVSEEVKFDVIVSNPPYIPSAEVDRLPAEIREFEPLSALDGGEDGTRFYRVLFGETLSRLRKGGFLAVEIDSSIENELLGMLDGFERFEVHRDLSGNDRVLVCWR